jgi:serine/threonine-protein kinase HipA
MPLSDRAFVFSELNPKTYAGLPPAFSDSMPDRFGNAIIDAELMAIGATYDQITALERLSYTGRRGMGALEYTPVLGPKRSTPSMVDIGDLVTAARATVNGSLDHTERTKSLKHLVAVGTSAGGARAKAVINVASSPSELAEPPASSGSTAEGNVHEFGRLTSGQFPKDNTTGWILKFDGVGKDNQLGACENYCRVEYAYSLMAKAAGIDFPQTRLLEEGGRAHFMTRRFDRPGGKKRLHMQTLCSMAVVDFNLIGVNNYSTLFHTINKLGEFQHSTTAFVEQQRVEAFRRMVFNYLASNCDDHTKNHTFLRSEAGQWALSPAYDVTFAYSSNSRWLNQHLMSVNGKFAGVTDREFIAFARQFQIPGARKIINEVRAAVKSWGDFAKQAALPQPAIDEVWGMISSYGEEVPQT